MIAFYPTDDGRIATLDMGVIRVMDLDAAERFAAMLEREIVSQGRAAQDARAAGDSDLWIKCLQAGADCAAESLANLADAMKRARAPEPFTGWIKPLDPYASQQHLQGAA